MTQSSAQVQVQVELEWLEAALGRERWREAVEKVVKVREGVVMEVPMVVMEVPMVMAVG